MSRHFTQHAADIALARTTAILRSEQAKQAEDRLGISVAFGNFAETLFGLLQPGICEELRDNDLLYHTALNELTKAIERRVWRLARRIIGHYPGPRWSMMFRGRMQQLQIQHRTRIMQLFQSDVGLVVQPGQSVEITVGGENPGVRINSVPEVFPNYFRQLITKRGFDGVRALAKQALLSPTVIHKLLNGKRVRPSTLHVLADVLGEPPAKFIALVHQYWGEQSKK